MDAAASAAEPCGQGLHTCTVVAPVEALKVPAIQSTHVEECGAQNVPALQSVQLGAQPWHDAIVTAAGSAQYLPYSHM